MASAQQLSKQDVPQPAAARKTVAPPTNEVGKIVVTGVRSPMRAGALRNDIVATESIDGKTVERRGATNVNEAVDNQPGIAVQVECSICNVRNVVLNNLPGRYTTLLIDGVPIYSSVSSAYGLDSVSVHGIERIDVARGAGVSLIAPEALSGTVNIVTKRPTKPEGHLRAQVGKHGSRLGELYLAHPFHGGAVAVTASTQRHDSVDADRNGISEFTGFRRSMGGLSYFVDGLGGFKLRGRLDVVRETRGGGALGRDHAAIRANRSSNPFDFSKGAHASPYVDGWIKPSDGARMTYNDGRGGFSEIITTKREQWINIAERGLAQGRLRLAVGLASHRQDSFYEGALYRARQSQRYAEASWHRPVGDWEWTLGADYRYEDLASVGATADGKLVRGIDNYVHRVPAAFVQVYRAAFDHQLELNASLRYDRHNVFGAIVSPRANLLWHHTADLSSRFSAGRGFRAPTSFFEQDHGILDTIRVQREITRPEISTNLGYALDYSGDRLNVTAALHYNRITNVALLDPGHVDALGQKVTRFTSAPRPVIVRGGDVSFSYLLTPALTVNGGAEFFRHDFAPGTLVFARPGSKAYLGFDFHRSRLDVTTRLVWTGPMNLARFHGDGTSVSTRYNFDGTPKRSRSPSFVTVDARVEYALIPGLAVYAGGNNLSDYKQADHESQLFVNAEGVQDVTHLWGPALGRSLYMGVKWAFR